VGDTRHYGLKSQPRPEVFFAHAQDPYWIMTWWFAHPPTRGNLLKSCHKRCCDWTLRNLLAVSSAWINCWRGHWRRTLCHVLLGPLCGTRLAAGWDWHLRCAAFAVPSERTRSGFGWRSARRRETYWRLVLAQGMKLACAGVLLGLGGALALTRL